MLGLMLLALATAGPQAVAPAAVGEKVPEFRVTDTAGKAWTLADLQKRTESGVVSLTFWCTFCHSCRRTDVPLQKLCDDLCRHFEVETYTWSVLPEQERPAGPEALAAAMAREIAFIVDHTPADVAIAGRPDRG